MSNLGQNIRNIRWSLGLTMSDFGEIIGGVKSGVVSNWENNKQKPNADRLKKIADIGNMKVVELVNGKDDYKQLYEQQKQQINKLKTEIIIINNDAVNSGDEAQMEITGRVIEALENTIIDDWRDGE
ncbi:helix-turn-helix domain-containing protein [Macrococcus capreoli]|uniref:helix-turn-helix domain-containing protein n=1 Tax=Macrococcus capreoli TaxID=2982690 RepID=UPI003F4220C2